MPDLPDAVAALLLDMELTEEERASINEFWLIDLELPCGLCPVWAAHKADLVPHFARRNPGKRPSRWWKYDAPRQPGLPDDSLFELPRIRLGGTGSALCEIFDGVEARCYLGIPCEWVVTPEDLQECAEAGVAATMIDPDDPPIYEAQATYLRRYHLFLRGEEKRLPPDAYDPERVEAHGAQPHDDGTVGPGADQPRHVTQEDLVRSDPIPELPP